MSRNKKSKILIASVLGVGLALGSPSLRALAADTNITGGATVTLDVQGHENEATNVMVDQGSTWIGSASGTQSNSMTIGVSGNSKWQGNQRISLGVGDTQITDSTWTGNSVVEGDPFGSWAQLRVTLENSNWKGNTSTSYGYTDITMNNNSSYEGAMAVESGSLGISAVDSSVKGDVVVRGTTDYRGYLSSNLNNSHWIGNADVEHGYFQASMMNYSTGVGDVKAVDGSVYIGGQDHSSWKGDLSSKGIEENQSVSVYVSMYDSSSYEGNVSVTTSGVNSYGNASVSLGQNSTWQGDFTTKSNGGDLSNNVSIYDNSSWVGNADTEQRFGLYLQGNSSWTGNAKVNASSVNYGGAYVNAYDHSTWKGSLEFIGAVGTSPDNAMYIGASFWDYSSWEGDFKASGNTFVDMSSGGNSTWIGNLDLTGNTHEDQPNNSNPTARVEAYDNSVWTGKVIDAGRSVDVYIHQGSVWNMTDGATLRGLYLDYGTLNFVPKADGFSTLTVTGNLNNWSDPYTSQINMNTNLARHRGDLLNIQGDVVGKYLVHVNNQGSARINPSKDLTIIKTAGARDDDAFKLTNNVEVGGFEYYMEQKGDNWNLTTGVTSWDGPPDEEDAPIWPIPDPDKPRLTTTASAGINSVKASYLLNYAETQTLLQRLGDLRQSEENNGVWAKISGGQFSEGDNGSLRGYDMDYTSFQAGYDRKIYSDAKKGDVYVGGMFGYSKGNVNYDLGSGSLDMKSMGAYGTYKAPNGFYADAVVKYGWQNGDFRVLDTEGSWVTNKDMKSNGLYGSLELGKRIYTNGKAKEGFYLEPQVQVSVGHQGSVNSTASNGLNIDIDGYNSTLGRAGLNVGYEVKSGKNPINVYGKASYVHEFDGDLNVKLNGIDVPQSMGDSWWVYGLGVTAKVGNKHNLYLDVERASGGEFKQSWAVNAGYRFNW